MEETKKTSVPSSSPPAAPTPNDDKSKTFNPNNPANTAAVNNTKNQMNPNNPAYRSSRGKK